MNKQLRDKRKEKDLGWAEFAQPRTRPRCLHPRLGRLNLSLAGTPHPGWAWAEAPAARLDRRPVDSDGPRLSRPGGSKVGWPFLPFRWTCARLGRPRLPQTSDLGLYRHTNLGRLRHRLPRVGRRLLPRLSRGQRSPTSRRPGSASVSTAPPTPPPPIDAGISYLDSDISTASRSPPPRPRLPRAAASRPTSHPG